MLRQLFLIAFFGCCVFAVPTHKIHPKLKKTIAAKNIADVIVKFENGNKAALREVDSLTFSSRSSKTAHLVHALRAHTRTTQANALSILKLPQFAYSAIKFKQLWISNEISVRVANEELIKELAALPEVSEIREAVVIKLGITGTSSLKETKIHQGDPLWNINIIEAPQAWNLTGGNRGEGVVVGHIDSGVRGTHEALRNNRFPDYGWFDPFTLSLEATDEGGHGTHTLGTVLGGNGIGVAPGAQWMSCKICFDWDWCPEEAVKACGEFLLCPTLHNGTREDCSKAPRVISNSWGYGKADFFNEVLDAWVAADIIPVFSIGNAPPNACGNNVEPGNGDNVISVGSTNSTDDISPDFSSPGPSPRGTIKPEICAPGDNVLSASKQGDDMYEENAGTSMATPHIAGVIALLLSEDPTLSFQEVKKIIEETAERDHLGKEGPSCGGIPITEFPNHHYGHGRVNARRALQAVINGAHRRKQL